MVGFWELGLCWPQGAARSEPIRASTDTDLPWPGGEPVGLQQRLPGVEKEKNTIAPAEGLLPGHNTATRPRRLEIAARRWLSSSPLL